MMIKYLKARQPFAIAYFTKAIFNTMCSGKVAEALEARGTSCSASPNALHLLTIPSHDPNYVNGITLVAKELCKRNSNFIDATHAIKRIKFVQSFCKSNSRNSLTLTQSISIDIDLIKNANILLLDDISTTGTSMLTIEKLLLSHGAASVTPIVMGQTIPIT